jgi:hypothetical protein
MYTHAKVEERPFADSNRGCLSSFDPLARFMIVPNDSISFKHKVNVGTLVC